MFWRNPITYGNFKSYKIIKRHEDFLRKKKTVDIIYYHYVHTAMKAKTFPHQCTGDLLKRKCRSTDGY